MVLYTPQTNVKLHGTHDFYGSFIGNTVRSVGASGSFHYDMNLRSLKTTASSLIKTLFQRL